MFGVVADHDVRQGLPIVARAMPEKMDMVGESNMQDNAQPAIFERDADDRSEESMISLGGGGAQRPRRRPEEDTSDRSENPIADLDDRDGEQPRGRKAPKSGVKSRFGFNVEGIKSRFGFNVVGRFRRPKVSQTILRGYKEDY